LSRPVTHRAVSESNPHAKCSSFYVIGGNLASAARMTVPVRAADWPSKFQP